MPGDVVTQVVARFAQDQYERILAVMVDAALLPPTHGAWRRGFEERLADLARRAVRPVVVTIDPEAFAAWCAAWELPCDADARMDYADWLAAARGSPWPARARSSAGLPGAGVTARSPAPSSYEGGPRLSEEAA
ncbi:MAG: hypothetical protein MUF07_10545 [Steroidobacteraceae bacterium]|jgi:hypothetical protein|nr:hypothetical protein [Steroidobacteraceae bacterium]